MEMMQATQELKLKLGIEEGSLITPRSQKKILATIKLHGSFTLKRKDYEDIISRIKASNASLHHLCTANRELEPGRRQRSQSRVTTLLRGLYQGIYNALYNTIICSCICSHRIGLQLGRINAIILPNDVEERVAQEFDFCIGFGTLGESDVNEAKQVLPHNDGTQPASHWKKFRLRLIEDGDRPPNTGMSPSASASASPSASASASISPSPSLKQTVRWALPPRYKSSRVPDSLSSATEPLAQTAPGSPTPTKGMEDPPLKVLNLCEMVSRKSKATAMECYGYVLDTRGKFSLSPPNDETGPRQHITLRQVIDNGNSDLPPFGFKERVHVALQLSVSVLHLSGTPWLTQMVTLDNIVFLTSQEHTMNQRAYFFYQPFVSSAVQPPPTLSAQTPGLMRPISLEALYLGVILIQIMIGRVENGLRMTDLADMRSIISRRGRGSELVEEVREVGGDNYAAAVTWCLDSIYGVANLQNDQYCHNFYQAVIARLEDDLKVIAPGG
ncbi:hypothetical protein SAMD00023353_7200550 [Rosellinia necatrix]|uniref:DUF7580 domain-containing protein n=1 Tax=Rosellinia necatrix TaxID=77044 RepID=A0A1W2TTL2_ROSNE|nr:hypothetical protein SAMD00023353_7200550 [Rosellinia necatrix]